MANRTVFQKLKENSEKIALVLILLLGFSLRIYHLSANPAGFFCDEASIGYNAYSLLHTGKDEYGDFLPVFFRSFGDYRPPLSVYSAIPFIGIFGLNEFATRLPSALYGMLILVALYLIGKELQSKRLGLLCAFSGAIMPWLIHYNRTGFEFTVYCAFFTFTVLFFLKSTKQKIFIIPSFITAALTLYTYQPARLLIPLLLIGVVVIFRKTFLKNIKVSIIGLLAFFLLSVPLVMSAFDGTAAARFNMISVFSAGNTPVEIIRSIFYNYFYQLSQKFFLDFEPTPITRHFTGGLVPILQITFPLMALGVLFTVVNFKQKPSQLLLYWLLIYPVAGAVVADPPFTSRAIIGAPLFAIYTAIGIYMVIKFFKHSADRKIAGLCIVLIILLNAAYFSKFYFVQYPRNSAGFWGWQYGPREIVTYFAEHQAIYDDTALQQVFNAPHIFFRFYAPDDCRKCKIGDPDSLYHPDRKQLFAVTPDYLQQNPHYNWKIIKTIFYPDRSPAFILAEIEKD